MSSEGGDVAKIVLKRSLQQTPTNEISFKTILSNKRTYNSFAVCLVRLLKIEKICKTEPKFLKKKMLMQNYTNFPLLPDRGSSVQPVIFFAFNGIDLKSIVDENSSDKAFSWKLAS